ncbi:SAM-dependent chlorinase/fluorinase [Isosphaeraceae bacterium EP7]
MKPGILTLTTDFGSDGPYVAQMKGVVLGLAPSTQFVDVSHGISPQNIAEGAFVLSGLIDVFPAGTVHLAVVDPGVGTDRLPIAARIDGHWFVAPDNGLLGGLLTGRSVELIVELVNPALRRPVVSATFHGRDIFAPAAAHLLIGGDARELGPALTQLMSLPGLEPCEAPGGILGQVLYRDRFGNLITNVDARMLAGRAWRIEIAGTTIDSFAPTYGESLPGTLIALFGSTDRVEVAVVNGDAAALLGAGPGTPVRFRLETHR